MSSFNGRLEKAITDILFKIKIQILFFFNKLQITFHYDSQFWSNRSTYNLPGGKTGFDLQETKLPTYWTTSFSKICLGTKIDNQLRFFVINKEADSLHSLIADGKYRATSVGRNAWKLLIGSQASLQSYCNKEGFNVVGDPHQSKARIGITANQENDCITCDSRIGLAQEVYMMTPTRVEMRQRSGQIMATGILKPWGTSWCYGRGHS